MAELIGTLAEAKERDDMQQTVTRGEQQEWAAAVASTLGTVIRQANDTAFFQNTMVEFLAVKGLKLNPAGRICLDPEEWNEYMKKAVRKQNVN